jgi:hypothetical protein
VPSIPWYLGSIGCINEAKNEAKKATRYVQYQLTLSTHTILILTHTQVTNTVYTVSTTLDYECRRWNKGTDLVLVPRKFGVYK